LSTSSEEQNKPEEKPQQQQETYYQRKKNWIGGIDNDNVTLFISLLGLGLGAVAAYPVARDIWNGLTQRYNNQQYPPLPQMMNGNGYQQQQLPNGEAYIPPTEPVPPQPQQPVQPIEQNVQPTEQPQEEETVDGRFYEDEMRKKAKMMGKRDRVKYESPFGKDIGGLG
jgi:hypothetical protein